MSERIEENSAAEKIYDAKVESILISQLEIGDYINFITKSGSRYSFKVEGKGSDEEGEKIYVHCVSGPEKMRDSQGRIKKDVIKVGERFKYGSAGTNNIKELIITRAPILAPVSKIEFNTSIFELESALLENGHVIYAETNSGSVYVLEVVGISEISGKPFVKIIGGNNNFKGDMGVLRNMVLGVGLSLKTDMMVTSPLKYLEIRRTADDKKPEDIQRETQLSAEDLTDPEAQMSGIIFVNLTREEKVALDALNLPSVNCTKSMIKRAWMVHLAEFKRVIKEKKGKALMQIKYRDEIDHEIIRIGYESLLARLGEKTEEDNL